MDENRELWRKAVAFHGHECGGLTIGYYQSQEPSDMFDVRPTAICLPEQAKLFDSYVCDCCGEVTGANWIRLSGGKKLCLDCYEEYDRFQV